MWKPPVPQWRPNVSLQKKLGRIPKKVPWWGSEAKLSFPRAPRSELSCELGSWDWRSKRNGWALFFGGAGKDPLLSWLSTLFCFFWVLTRVLGFWPLAIYHWQNLKVRLKSWQRLMYDLKTGKTAGLEPWMVLKVGINPSPPNTRFKFTKDWLAHFSQGILRPPQKTPGTFGDDLWFPPKKTTTGGCLKKTHKSQLQHCHSGKANMKI